MNFY
jgi:hypothetical protein